MYHAKARGTTLSSNLDLRASAVLIGTAVVSRGGIVIELGCNQTSTKNCLIEQVFVRLYKYVEISLCS